MKIRHPRTSSAAGWLLAGALLAVPASQCLSAQETEPVPIGASAPAGAYEGQGKMPTDRPGERARCLLRGAV